MHKGFLMMLTALVASTPASVFADDVRDPVVIGKFSVYKKHAGENKFANTGLAYDTKRHLLLIGNCYNNSVEFYDKTGQRTREALTLDHLGAEAVQGVAYDTSDDSLWIWATRDFRKDTSQACIWHCDMQGHELDPPFEFAPVKYSPGMLSYDPHTDSLWANPYGEPTLYRISCKTKTVEATLKPAGLSNTEGLAYDPFDKTFWLLNTTRLFHVKRDGDRYTLIQAYHNPSENCPEDRAALDALGKLKIEGTDWTFVSQGGAAGTITRASGGLESSAVDLRPRRWILVQGSEHNDKLFRILDMNDTTMTVRNFQDTAGVRDEAAGRNVAVSLFVRGSDEGIAVDPTDHTIWINTDTDKGSNKIPGCNRCWHLDPLGVTLHGQPAQ